MPRALIGTIYLTQTAPKTAMTNMAPVYAMPETTAGTMPATAIDQVIPGVTTTLPTPSNPTVQALNVPMGTTTQPATPWYQWFVDHPLATGGIAVGVILVGVLVFKKKKTR